MFFLFISSHIDHKCWCIVHVCSRASWPSFDSFILSSFRRTNASWSQLCLCSSWNPWCHWRKLCMHHVFLYSMWHYVLHAYFNLFIFGHVTTGFDVFVNYTTIFFFWEIIILPFWTSILYFSQFLKHIIVPTYMWYCHCTNKCINFRSHGKLTVPYYVYGSH